MVALPKRSSATTPSASASAQQVHCAWPSSDGYGSGPLQDRAPGGVVSIVNVVVTDSQRRVIVAACTPSGRSTSGEQVKSGPSRTQVSVISTASSLTVSSSMLVAVTVAVMTGDGVAMVVAFTGVTLVMPPEPAGQSDGQLVQVSPLSQAPLGQVG